MELSEALFSLLHAIKHQIIQQVKQSDLDLSLMHLKTLKMISMIELCTGQKLASLIGRDKAQINRLIKELVNQELVIKTQDVNDGRSYFLSLTKHGLALIAKFNEIENNVLNNMARDIPPEDIKAFIELAKVFKKNLTIEY